MSKKKYDEYGRPASSGGLSDNMTKIIIAIITLIGSFGTVTIIFQPQIIFGNNNSQSINDVSPTIASADNATQVILTSTPTPVPTSIPNTQSAASTHTVLANGCVIDATQISTLRPQTTFDIGTGIFDNATRSDGMEAISSSEIGQFYCVDFVNPGSPTANGATTDGCIISSYRADVIWFGNSGRTNITVRDNETNAINNIGEFSGSGMLPHGFMINLSDPIEPGDEICIEDPSYPPTGGFALYLGPDVYQHYDSYCFRGLC